MKAYQKNLNQLKSPGKLTVDFSIGHDKIGFFLRFFPLLGQKIVENSRFSKSIDNKTHRKTWPPQLKKFDKFEVAWLFGKKLSRNSQNLYL